MLFDLESDLSEKHDLAVQHPDRVARMKADLMKWEDEVVAGLPYRILPEDQALPTLIEKL